MTFYEQQIDDIPNFGQIVEHDLFNTLNYKLDSSTMEVQSGNGIF